MSRIKAETAAILGIIGVAAILRAVQLNSELWYDEIATVVSFVRMPAQDLIVTYGSLNNHLLYTWLAKGSAALFGETPWALRLAAAVFGVLSIWAVWRLVRMTGFAGVALAVAALLAVSYHHVWFSQNARGYTGMLLFTTLSALFMARGLKTAAVRDWTLYAVCAAAALATHLTSAFLLVAQGLTALAIGYRAVFIQKQTTAAQWIGGPLIGFGGGVVIALAVYLPMAPGMLETFASYNAPEAGGEVTEWKNPLWTIVETLHSFGVVGFALPLAAIFAVAGAWRLARRAPAIAAPYLIHVPLTMAILILASFRIWPRYFFVDIGFLLTCAVAGAFWFAEVLVAATPAQFRLGVSAKVLKTIGAALMVLLSLPLLAGNYAAPKQNFAGARELVRGGRRPNDAVAVVGLAALPYRDYLKTGWTEVSRAEEIAALERAHDSVWIVTAFPAHLEASFPDVAARLDQDFEIVGEFSGTLSGGEVAVWRSRDR